MQKFLALHISLFLLLLFAQPSPGAEWREVTPADVVRMPDDLYFQKEYRVQWWYFTGHLFDSSGREFGYELTFFAAGVQRREYESEFGVNCIYLSHFAVSDVDGNKFYHYGNADSGAYGFAGADERRLRVWVDEASLEGSGRRMHIRARAGEIGLDLVLAPQKPVVLHGYRGYSRKSEVSPLIASRYFSFTDLATTGTLKVGRDVLPVTGKSWFDREISSRGLVENEGWDWFAIQLQDGREIMLYQIRNKDGTIDPFSSGTLVYQNGTYRHLTIKDFRITVLSSYTSGHTGARYPSRWEVTVPSENLKLRITPLIQDQEFIKGGVIRKIYWEGTCRVEGTAQGGAYVEMTGYE